MCVLLEKRETSSHIVQLVTRHVWILSNEGISENTSQHFFLRVRETGFLGSSFKLCFSLPEERLGERGWKQTELPDDPCSLVRS